MQWQNAKVEFEGTSKLEGEMKEWGVKETTTATGSSLMECQSHDYGLMSESYQGLLLEGSGRN